LQNGQLTVNGSIVAGNFTGKNIRIQNGNVIIDGQNITPDSKSISIEVHGNVAQLDTGGCLETVIKGDVGSIDGGSGDIECKNVTGSISTGSGYVSCETIGGNVSTGSGDVQANSIMGSVKTGSGDIYKNN
jgi:hypothetical protein